MAQITQVRLVDDLDGGEAAESVSFSLDGKSYEIDLNEKHAAALRDAFAPFVGSARRAGGSAVGSRPRMSTRTSTGSVGRVRRPQRSVSGPSPTGSRCRPAAVFLPQFSRRTRIVETQRSLPSLLSSRLPTLTPS